MDHLMIQQPGIGDHTFGGVWPEQAQARRDKRSTTWTGFGIRRWTAGLIGQAASPLVGVLRRKIIRSLPLPSGRVLEVGVGRGTGLKQYDHRTAELAGTEANAGQIFRARQRLAARPLDHVTGLYRWTPDRLGFRDATFDAVTAFFLFEPGRRPRAILRELSRVTRPDGRIFVINWLGRRSSQREGGWKRRLRRFAGVRRPIPTGVLLADSPLKLVAQRRADPFGLLTVLEFAKRG